MKNNKTTQDKKYQFREKFDIIIGNPPYGYLSKEYAENIINNFKFYEERRNTASIFVELSKLLANEEGVIFYVLPKSLTYVKSWSKVRDFIVRQNKLLIVVDLSKAFENVEVEQVIIGFKKIKQIKDYNFLVGKEQNKKIEIHGSLSTKIYNTLNIIPIYVDNNKIEIYNKIINKSKLLRQISKTFRGFSWQRYISPEGTISVLRGKNIEKYKIHGKIAKVKLDEQEVNLHKLNQVKQQKIISQRILSYKIVSQNIVSYSPKTPNKIMIKASLDKENYLTLNTVMNTIITDKTFSYEYVLGILNSSLAEWFFCNFVYNKAVMTMHFDQYYIGKLPIKIPSPQNKNIISKIERLVNILLSNKPDKKRKIIEDKINKLVFKLYELTDDEIKIIET